MAHRRHRPEVARLYQCCARTAGTTWTVVSCSAADNSQLLDRRQLLDHRQLLDRCQLLDRRQLLDRKVVTVFFFVVHAKVSIHIASQWRVPTKKMGIGISAQKK